MKMTQNHIDSLVRRVLLPLEKGGHITFNKTKEAILAAGKEIINKDFEKEAELEKEVMKMVEALEAEQGENFDRHRMFKMMKKKVADERGIVL